MRLRSDRKDAALVHEIREAARMIGQHLKTLQSGTFHDDWLVRDAVCMRLVVIGEAASRLSEEFKAALPDLNWKGIIRTRHLLSHDYGAGNPDVLWVIATQRVVELEQALSAIQLDEPD